jgi:hypothetical protein
MSSVDTKMRWLHSGRIWVSAAVIIVAVVGLVSTNSLSFISGQFAALPQPSSAPVSDQNVCGNAAKPPERYDHVIWILEENKSLSQVIGNKDAPFISSLARQCGYSTNYGDDEPRPTRGLGYHSLSHYLAGVSGSNCDVGNDRLGTNCMMNDAVTPAKQKLSTESIFHQVQTASLSWRSYQESAPNNCSLFSRGLYAARHDAALYFDSIRPTCSTFDIAIPGFVPGKGAPTGPLIEAISQGNLPTFAYITPNLINDMHNGSVKHGDAWLKSYLEPLFRSAEYRAGRTAVFIIWDEAPKTGQPLPNLVIAPSVRSGAVAAPMNGFTVLGATEQLLGLPPLGCASGKAPGGVGTCGSGATTDLRAVFGL